MRAVTDSDVETARAAAATAHRDRLERRMKLIGQILTAAWIVETVVLEALGIAALVRWLRS